MTTFFLLSFKILSIDRIIFCLFWDPTEKRKFIYLFVCFHGWQIHILNNYEISFTMVKPMKSKSSKSSTASSIVGMSSDVDDDDQVLPDSLRKLEIVSVYSNSLAACKANNERHQNPFLTELSTESSANDRVCILELHANEEEKTKQRKLLTRYMYDYIICMI